MTASNVVSPDFSTWGLNFRAHSFEELVITQPQQGQVFRQVKLCNQYVTFVRATLPRRLRGVCG